MSTSLLTPRGFAALFWTQFFAAFSDNVLKQALIFLILCKIAGTTANVLVTLAPAIFIFPYFVLSAFGGEMADRYDKAMVAQRIKLAEIGVSALAVLGFWLHTVGHDTIAVSLLFFSLFGFGVCGSLFGPIKYGIFPDHLARSELP